MITNTYSTWKVNKIDDPPRYFQNQIYTENQVYYIFFNSGAKNKIKSSGDSPKPGGDGLELGKLQYITFGNTLQHFKKKI